MRSIAYLGPEGTFSHLLAVKRFGAGVEGRPCSEISGVFSSVADGESSLGVVPVENSSGGTIYDTVDHLIRYAGKIYVREELNLDVRLALLGRSKVNRPRRIFSHFAPLQHHREWLQQRYPGASIVAVNSTAEAAKKAAADSQAFALAAKGAADLYGLDVLLFPIRPEAVNVTRFYVVGPAPVKPKAGRKHKTAIIFSLRNETGSLHSFLGPLARRKVNLRAIVSRPLVGHPETYVFFVEIDGAVGELHVDAALRAASRFCHHLTPLGSFPGRKRFFS
jgi:chorismate mutase/prephenate dehydratase